MKKIKITIITLAALIGFTALAPAYVGASPASDIQDGVSSAGGSGSPLIGAQLKIVINILLFVLGAIAVIMIVIGGIRYTTSNGDSSSLKAAKDTILYAVVGLIVALLAYSIVNFVLTSFK